MDSIAYMTCTLKVDTQTPGWHQSLIKVLKSIDEVRYSIDAEQGIAQISGKIDPGKLLKMLAKAEKHAEICWIDSGKHKASSPRMAFNGYYNAYYSNGGYGSRENYYLNHYSHYDQHYPFYEPSAPQDCPQAPEAREDFNVGDAQWCTIM